MLKRCWQVSHRRGATFGVWLGSCIDYTPAVHLMVINQVDDRYKTVQSTRKALARLSTGAAGAVVDHTVSVPVGPLVNAVMLANRHTMFALDVAPIGSCKERANGAPVVPNPVTLACPLSRNVAAGRSGTVGKVIEKLPAVNAAPADVLTLKLITVRIQRPTLV